MRENRTSGSAWGVWCELYSYHYKLSSSKGIMNFTDEEKALIKRYSEFPITKSRNLNLWALDVIIPLLILCFGIYSESIIYLVTAIVILVIFNIMRLIKRENLARILKSICTKLISAPGD